MFASAEGSIAEVADVLLLGRCLLDATVDDGAHGVLSALAGSGGPGRHRNGCLTLGVLSLAKLQGRRGCAFVDGRVG